jgi:hypothetical protein
MSTGRLGAGAVPRRVYVLIAVCVAAGVFLRFYQLARPGYLLGVTEYDDGVNFGNALRLVSGVVPYRDFVVVQPPGGMLLMTPAALLAKLTGSAWGMGGARLVTAGADTACVALLGLLVRHRGVIAVGVAAGVYAVYPDALVAAHTVMLEPWLNLFCLIGALLVFGGDTMTDDRRMALGGAAFGFAAAVKLWALVPLLLVGLLLLAGPGRLRPPGRWRRLRVLAGGAAAGLGVAVLPFLVLAPGAVLRDAVVSQFVRSGQQHGAPLPRLSDLAGFSLFPGTPAGLRIGVLAAIAVAIPAGYAAAKRLPTELDWYAMLGLVLVVAIFLWSASYHPHYGAFAGPFIALALALPAGLLWPARDGYPILPAVVAGLVAAAALTGAGVRQFTAESHLQTSTSLAASAGRLIPPGSCVFTNDSSLTISANRFTSATAGCPAIVDTFGTLLAMTGGRETGAPAEQVNSVRALLLSAFSRARYVWLEPGQIPWTPRLDAYIDSHFRLIGLVSSAATSGIPASGLYVRR